MSVLWLLFRLDEDACTIEADPLDRFGLNVIIRLVWVARWPLSWLMPGQHHETFHGTGQGPWHRPSGEWAPESVWSTLDALHWSYERAIAKAKR